MKTFAIIFIPIIFFTSTIFCSGVLDATFGTSGVVLTSIGLTDFINSSTIQPDGNIVVTGASITNAATSIATARYTTAGALDTTFDADGIQTLLVGTRTEGNAIGLQSDDKILIGGFAYTSQTVFILVRYNTDGTLDNTFNGTGYTTTLLGVGASANSIGIQSDGKIIAAGAMVNGAPCFILVRYNTDGTIDATFGSSGIVVTPIGSAAVINQIQIQPDGKIVACGYTNDGSVIGFALARYNTDGSLDGTFGTSGIVITNVGSLSMAASLAIQTDGSIVVAGFTFDLDLQFNKFALVRYTSSGSLDATFGSSGIVITQVQHDAQVNSVAIQPDGKILAGGYSLGDTATQFALARYNTNGTLDGTYGSSGIALTTINGNNSDSTINSIVIQADGKCVASGFSNNDFALARYTA